METPATPAAAAANPDSLRRDVSVAKNLFFGEIVEENLFPYPTMRDKDQVAQVQGVGTVACKVVCEAVLMFTLIDQ